jgi:hypothetical protein
MRKDIMRFRLILAGVIIASSLAAACGGFVDPSNNKDETFTGTVQPLGFAVTKFTVSQNGEYFVTLNSLTPPLPNNLPTDVRVTAIAGSDCVSTLQVAGDNQNSVPGRQVLSGVLTKGTFCLWILDEGDFSVPETYSVTVNHS